MTAFTESVVEEAALSWLAELGWAVVAGPTIAPLEAGAERADYGEVVLAGLRDALLPKLLSGEIRVPEAKQRVEDRT